MRKLLCFSILFFIGFLNVNATTYYENQNGVEFTEEQYEFITAMYYDGYQAIMTQDDFDFYGADIMHAENVISNSVTDDYFMTRGTMSSDSAKTLKIARSLSTRCLVATTLTWNGTPSVKSYDVIGARKSNGNFASIATTVSSDAGASSDGYRKDDGEGFGVSVHLPSSTSIKVAQTFSASLGGKVYASYQHATTAVTLSQSQNYSINSSGYGGVFDFAYAQRQQYDGMTGVQITC